tara:strand:- start:657 stop:1523 length:867 start_codon:yes stop_codon:yes gene_type:complete
MPATNDWLENLGQQVVDNLESFQTVNYPIYVPSKARADVKLTTQALADVGLDFYVVVEPQDAGLYLKHYDMKQLVIMEMNDQGIGYVRNACKKHSISIGADFHWQVDDNIKDFRVREGGKNVVKNTRNVFAAAEHYMSHFDNIGIGSLSHSIFAFARNTHVSVNRQAYSCVLVNNSLDIWYRHDCIEDTDYSLQVLDKGYCTILFNKLLMGKAATGQYKGGNTDTVHAGDGRLIRSRKLQEYWPGAFKVVKKKERWHVAPSRVWDKFPQMPKGPNVDLNTNTLDDFFC